MKIFLKFFIIVIFTLFSPFSSFSQDAQDLTLDTQKVESVSQYFSQDLESWFSSHYLLPELVTVGDPGNSADPLTGLGAVSKPFQIGKYEVTVGQYFYFVMAVTSNRDSANPDPHHLWHEEIFRDSRISSIADFEKLYQAWQKGQIKEWHLHHAIERELSLPVTHVTLNDAKRYCNWLEHGAPFPQEGEGPLPDETTETGSYQFLEGGNGKPIEGAVYRLPTLNEWVKAGYYRHSNNDKILDKQDIQEGYWNYPTQEDTLIQTGTEYQTANYGVRTWNGSIKPFLSEPVKLMEVDYFENINKVSSHYKVVDMGGNVSEWTETLAYQGETTWYNFNDPQLRESYAYTPGGSWHRPGQDLNRAQAKNNFKSVIDADNETGFRIVANEDQLINSVDKNCIPVQSLASLNKNSFTPNWNTYLAITGKNVLGLLLFFAFLIGLELLAASGIFLIGITAVFASALLVARLIILPLFVTNDAIHYTDSDLYHLDYEEDVKEDI